MTLEDYQVLHEMLEEFRREAGELQARIEEYAAYIREAELHLRAIVDSEPEDRKVFSPRKAEVLYKEEIQKIEKQKALHEERRLRLCEEKSVIEGRVARLEAVCRHQREPAGSRWEGSLTDLEKIAERIQGSGSYIDRNPIQARQELAIIAKSIKETVARMREEERGLR